MDFAHRPDEAGGAGQAAIMACVAAELAERPLFGPLAPLLRDLQDVADLDHLNARARACEPRPCVACGQPIRFVEPVDAPTAYEHRVHTLGEVMTRPGNWHDFFNALVWLRFPRTKAALNALHVDEMARQCAPDRGPLRDAATQFDESGVVILSADPSLFELLRAHRWVELFWERRADVIRQMRFIVFGHGVYDALRVPFHGLCGRSALVDVESELIAASADVQIQHADAVLARRFDERTWYPKPKCLLPLPLLGIPGVDPRNEALSYYEDARQFRPLAQVGRSTR